MFDKIYSNGCSFMWGHHHNNPWYFKYFEETKDIDISKFLEESKKHNQQKENTQYTNPNVFQPFNDYDWVREKYNYASRVADGLGIQLINESIFGGSFNRVIRKTVKYIIENTEEHLKSTLFLIEIPPSGRNEMYFCNENRYVNFAGDNNFDFIKPENFDFIVEWYEKSFEENIHLISEYQQWYLLLNLFISKNIKFKFIQTDDKTYGLKNMNKTHSKYGSFEKLNKIQKEINKNSVKFETNHGGTYHVTHWYGNICKAKFSDDTNGISLDGHNSIRGSKLIADQIINDIKNNF
jgi:hypothetical protein